MQTILSAVDYAEAESKVIKIPRKQKDNKYTNFFRNFKFFYDRAKELSDSQLNSFAKTLTDSCEVIEIKSWQVEQAITMFNSLNSDGLPLYDSDIISAKLYAEAEKSKVSDEFTKLWKELIELIDELKQSGIANIDAILMQQMYFERAKNKNNEIVTATGSINVTTPGLRRYFTDDNKELLNDPIGLCNQMINIAKIWKKASAYPVIQVLLKFNDNAKLFLASYFHRFDADKISEEDVIEWSEDPSTYIAASLLPAQVLAVDVKEEEKFAQVIVPDDQLSLAIGKAGQNARLAARLTNWKIDIKSESQFREMLASAQESEEDELDLDEDLEENLNENDEIEENLEENEDE